MANSAPYTVPHSNRGLDVLIDGILGDEGLDGRLSVSEIRAGAEAADVINRLILRSIVETGVANDGEISAGDIYAMNAWIRENRYKQFVEAHGDDEAGIETGFHLVQGDGSTGRLFGHNLVNTVADGLYHIGFEISGHRFTNEDGKGNLDLDTAAEWLNALLARDLETGRLANGDISLFETGTTGTGLDLLVEFITEDAGLGRKLSDGEIAVGAEGADLLNNILLRAIRQTGVDGDNVISVNDLYSINAWIRSNKAVAWERGYGEEAADGTESGFLAVESNGARNALFGENAINEVANSIFQLGFTLTDGRVTDGEGHKGASLNEVASWLTQLLRGDFETGDSFGVGMRGALRARVELGDAPARAGEGTGLSGFVYDRSSGFSNIQDFIAYASGESPSHRFDAHEVRFGTAGSDHTVENFIGEAGTLTRGDGSTDMTTIGVHLNGFIYISEGWHDITVTSDNGFQLVFNGQVFSEMSSGTGPTTRGAYFEGGLYRMDLYHFENWGGQDLVMELDGHVVGGTELYTSIEDYEAALATHGAADAPLAGEAVLEIPDRRAPDTAGSGLKGVIFSSEGSFYNLNDLKEQIAGLEAGEDNGLTQSHTFDAGLIDFGGSDHSGRVEDFLSGAGALTSGAGGDRFSYKGVVLEGYVYISEGYHTLTVTSDDGFELSIGGDKLMGYQWGRSMEPSSATRWFEGGLYAIEMIYFENGGAEGLRLEMDGELLGAEAFYQSVEDFEAAMAGTPPEAVRLREAGPRAPADTGTGLDQLVEVILTDDELNRRLDDDTISNAARSANTLNHMLVEAIRMTGIANDGVISGSDIWAISDYIRSDTDREAAYLEALGDNGDQLLTDALGPAEQRGSSADDRLVGDIGEDVLIGGGGDDILRGGLGLDVIDGGGGNDRIYGGADRDIIDAGNGDDRVEGEGGADVIRAGGGDDIVSGGAANDLIEGGAGHDVLQGDAGRDWLYGEDGHDSLRGGTGDDVMDGGAGRDDLRGNEGNDYLRGGTDNDTLMGDEGDDALISVADGANDVMSGGSGADSFHIQIIRNDNGRLMDIGVDTITDYAKADGDQILIHGEGGSVRAIQSRSDRDGDYSFVILEDGDGNNLGRLKVYGDALSLSDLVFTGTPTFDMAMFEGRGALYAGESGGVLRDGRGEQVMIGGAGNDQFYAFADYGEPDAYQIEGYRYYEGEPYEPSGDVMFGGEGADTFTFIIPIAAKVHILAEHTKDGGGGMSHGAGFAGNEMNMDGYQVNWHGVAGENQNLHDHWVDSVGLQNMILDYDASEDTIEVLGHTTEILRVDWVDEDDDGIYDYSVIYPFSDQGAGAHNRDMLGSIIVYGDLVDIDDIVTDAGVHYGTELLEGAHPLSLETIEARREESGIFTIEGEGGSSRLFDRSAINTILEAIYAAGTGVVDDEVVDAAGLARADTEDVAAWLNSLLADELGDGSLRRGRADPESRPDTSRTGLDTIIDIIYTDEGLQANIPLEHMIAGAEAAATINELIVNAIRSEDLYSDGEISTSDIYAISDWIRANESRYESFLAAHGDDVNQFLEYGYHYVQNDGATSRLFGDNALNTVADGIYHIGFEIKNGRLTNEDGNTNARVETVAYWINELLKDGNINKITNGATAYDTPHSNRGLDVLIDGILGDEGLDGRLSVSEIRAGAEAADVINRLILRSIVETGVANDGEISAGDIYAMNAWIRENRYKQFVEAHGDDEAGIETGFHLVQGDGSTGRLFGHNLVNTVADGLYHIGFEISGHRFTNEDGKGNLDLDTAAEWLNALLARDLETGRLANGDISLFETGTTGTGLDLLVEFITEDAGLGRKLSDGEIAVGAEGADLLNNILLRAIRQTGVDGDNVISVNDLYSINAWIRSNKAVAWERGYGEEAADGTESGFLAVESNGARNALFGENAINEVANSIFQLGFTLTDGRVTDGEGHKGASLNEVASWLTQLLRGDFETGDSFGVGMRGALRARVELGDAPARAGEGTGLSGFVYDRSSGFSNIQDFIAYASGESPSHRFDAHEVRFGTAGSDHTVENFIGEAGTLTRGDGSTDMTTIGVHLNGFIYISEGWHDITVTSDNGFQLVFNGQVFSEMSSGTGPTTRGAYFEGGLYRMDLYHFENWGGQDLVMELDGHVVGGTELYTSIEDYEAALATHGAADAPLAGEAVLEIPDRRAPDTAGSGLKGVIFSSEGSFYNLNDLKEQIAGLEAGEDNGLTQSHTFDAGLIDFGGSDHSGRVEDFLSGAGALTSGAGGDRFSYKGVVLEGYVYISEGYHTLTVTSDDGFELSIGGDKLMGYQWGRSMEPSSATRWFEGGLYAIEMIYFENGGAEGLRLEMDGELLGAEAFYQSVEDFEAAMAGTPPEAVRLRDAGPRAPADTGTGLDQLVEIILTDDELNRRLDDDTISNAARSANTLNHMLVEAIRMTGIANDGVISGSDIWAISDYIRSDTDREAAYLEALGDNGDQLLTDALGPAEQRGSSADDRLVGDIGEDVLLGGGGDDILRGGLGLDVIDGGGGNDRIYGGADRDIIDAGNGDDRVEGEGGADVIRAGGGDDIVSGGAANDLIEGGAGHDVLQGDAGRDWLYGEDGHDSLRGGTGDDVMDGGAGRDDLRGNEGNDYLRGGTDNDTLMGDEGDDALISVADGANDVMSGGSGADSFHIQIIRNDNGRLMDIGVDTITDYAKADGDQILIHGEGGSVRAIQSRSDRDGDYSFVILEDGDGNNLGRLKVYGDALSLSDLVFTGTPTFDMAMFEGRGALYAGESGGVLRDGRGEQVMIGGAGNDQFYAFADYGEPDAYQIEGYRYYEGEPYEPSGDVMFGGEGADTFTFIIPIAAKVHILAEHTKDGGGGMSHGAGFAGNEMNMDGYQVNWHGVAGENQNLHDHWVDSVGLQNMILDYDASEDTIEVLGHTTEILRVDWVDEDDDGIYDYSVIYPFSDQGAGAHNRDMLGSIIVYGDLVDIDDIVTDAGVHYGTELLEGAHPLSLETIEARREESGIFTIEGEGGSSRLFDRSAINTILEAIYAAGTGVVDDEVVDAAGLARADTEDVAAWLNSLLADELGDGSLRRGRADPESRPDTSRTGLDTIIDIIYTDEGLQANIPLEHMIAGAEAAATINELIVNAIRSEDLYSDGEISTSDIYAISDWIRANESRYESFLAAHGDDVNQFLEYGYHYVQNDGATSRLFGDNALNTVADGIYHIGFEIKNGRLTNEDGNTNARVETVAYWINELLKDGNTNRLIPKAVDEASSEPEMGTDFEDFPEASADTGVQEDWSL